MLLWSQSYASHGRDSPILGHDSELNREVEEDEERNAGRKRALGAAPRLL